MKGVGGLLAVVCLLATAVVVCIVIASSDADAGTTYVEGPWTIDRTTELRDGTWIVNGSMYVTNGTLTLDHAELVVGGASDMSLYVNDTGRMVARNSTIRGGTSWMYFVIDNDTTLDNTTFRDVSYFYHTGGDLLLDHCSVASPYLYSLWNLTVLQGHFTAFSSNALYWSVGSSGAGAVRVRIVGTVFEGSGSGTAVSLDSGSSFTDECAIEVSGCTFRNASTAISMNWYPSTGSIVIQGNDARECASGVYFSGDGGVLRMRDNSWSINGASGSGLYLSLSSSTQPDISNETVVGGGSGLILEGQSTRPHIQMWDLDITGSRYGISDSYVNLDLYRSRVRGSYYDFYLYGSVYIHLHGCDHTYKGYVSSGSGSISEVRTVNITSVAWQEGTPITEGMTAIENETGYPLAERDNMYPWPVDLPLWLRTRYANVTARTARGAYEKDGFVFRGAPFDFTSLDRYDMVIYDNFTPEATFAAPHDGDKLSTNTLLVKGDLVEKGVGLANVRLMYTGGGWANVTTYPDWTWQLRFEGLPEGLLDFTLNITDLAGNSREVVLANITIDTVWPVIDVLRPGKWVRSSPVRLVARTEVGAQAWVDHAPVAVMPDGMFSALIDVYGVETVIDIRVVDVVGHENHTVVKVVMDQVPPALQVDSPADGAWTSAEAVDVTGMTESDAVVSVNAYASAMVGGRFRVTVPLDGSVVVLTVTAVDPAGNVAILVRTVHVDRRAPELAILEPSQGCMTARDRIVVRGTVADAGPVAVTMAGLRADVTGGAWALEVALVEGLNVIGVHATDAAGNAASTSVTVELDTVAPSLEAVLAVGGVVHGPGGTVVTRERRVELRITVDEDCTVRMTGGAVLDAGEGTSKVQRDLVPGENVIVVMASDAVGNEAPPMRFVVVWDDVRPALSISGPAGTDQVVVTREPVLLLAGLTEPGAEVSVNGQPAPVLSNGSFALAVPLAMGPNSLVVIVRDAAGNEATETVQVVREEEEQGPTVGAAMAAGGVAGLVVGLIAALAISWAIARRRRPPEGKGKREVLRPTAGHQAPPQRSPPGGYGGPQGGTTHEQPPDGSIEWEQY